jgi:membrane-bound lytic murein transglycosylase D
VDRPVSELRELNPAVLKNVAPAGYRLHVPKGTLVRLEEAFDVIPPNRRDSWRVERVESGDTLASVARRYGTTAEAIRSANRDGLPETGDFVAVPLSYAGDRVVTTAKRTVVSARTHGSTSGSAAKKSVAAIVSGTTQKRVTPSKAPSRQSSVAQKASAKNTYHRVPGA